jgi:hypothetical protein
MRPVKRSEHKRGTAISISQGDISAEFKKQSHTISDIVGDRLMQYGKPIFIANTRICPGLKKHPYSTLWIHLE